MPARLMHCTVLLLVAVLSLPARAEPEHLALLGRSVAPRLNVTLNDEQLRWLHGRRQLVLGTSAPDYPPFDITVSGKDYEGLTADYAGILATVLGLPIRVNRYANRSQAMAALRDGHIDLLGSANGYEADTPEVQLSQPYAVDRPVLVTRIGETRSLSEGLAGLRLSMVDHYLPAQQVQANYPDALRQTYRSYQAALNAVAFDQADVFLGDTISAHYLINQGLLTNVQMANFSKDEPNGFSFAVARQNPVLLGLVNDILNAVPAGERERIFKRWSAGSDILLTDHKLQLSAREERWLADHPVVRVVINETFAPLTFLDRDGTLRGITADLLELIRLRTGLRLEIQRARSVEAMIEQVTQGKADLIAAIIPSEGREQRLQFSRPYLENSYVLVSRKDALGFGSLEQLQGHRLALTHGNPLVAWLGEHYPDIHLIETEDAFSAMDLLAQGQADAAVNSLVIANYFMASPLYQDRLQIRASLPTQPAAYALAMARNDIELGSIIDKALLSIGPDELGIINGRWRGYSPDANAYWRNYHQLIYQILAAAGGLLLLSFLWIGYMRRQIRQRIRAERALSDQLELMRALVDGTPHPVYVRDREGRLQDCNDSYLTTFAARREEVIGKRVTDGLLVDLDQASTFAQDYREVMASGKALIMDRPLNLGDRQLTIYHWILAFRDSSSQVQGIIGGWIDISERRELLQALHQAKDLADAANTAKSTFLATMSHEIRTPMNAVIGMLELALKRADNDTLDRAAIEVAYASARELLELIGDILDIARIESGRLRLSPERTNLRELVESVARVFDGLARQKHLSLVLDIDPKANLDVLLDPLRFKQVLSNLVSNAIKFTEQGQVALSLQVDVAHDRQRVQVRVQVQDSGIGISQADQQRLFQPFVQAGTASQGRSGTGLGLVICRGLCEMMGATLQLSSQPGQGTQVGIDLSVLRLEPIDVPPPAPLAPGPALGSLKALVVDDHPANRLLMTQQLEYLGLTASTAENGEQGLHQWLQAPCDLVVVDCNMPVMDGYALARSIRHHERQAGWPPCTLLGYTASAQPEERERCLAAGMDECLFKPISLAELAAHLNTLAPRQAVVPYDLQGVHLLTGGNPLFERRLLAEMLDSSQHDRQSLQAIAQSGEHQALIELAHRIKGAARIVQAREVTQACEALEAALEQGAVAALVTARRQQLVACLQAFEQSLKAAIAQANTEDPPAQQ
ncbi:transporter substrate-binding domain-containing protein [Pseudomonas abieticivorans]|uniref:transporter substrate-binding domain-containing protein n=1 Tax=Pseudomonas abieticivorans TaxID=2931382 RepID=UPI003F691372